MKKIATFTISLLAAAVAATGASSAASADIGDPTVYPGFFIQNLTFDSLTDYAVGDDAYAFAEGKNVKTVENGELTVYELDYEVAELDYADGVFYYRDSRNNIGVLPDLSPAEHTFEWEYQLSAGDYSYYINDYGLNIVDVTKPVEDSGVTLSGYTRLKKYNGAVYAMCDNILYSFDGTEAFPIELTYADNDYSAAREIYIGDTLSALKNYSGKIATATLKSAKNDGSPVYMTEINMELLTGEYFSVGNTYRVGSNGAPAAGDKMLLLCTTGNASVISDGKTAYILDSDGISVTYSSPAESDYDTATVSIENAGQAYYLPYICGGTQSLSIPEGTSVTLLGKADKADYPFLSYDFYLIGHTDGDGETVMGYMPAGFLSAFTFAEKPTETTEDPSYTEESNVKTVVVLFVVVVLVLIAAGYLVYVGTSNKKNDSSDDAEENNS